MPHHTQKEGSIAYDAVFSYFAEEMKHLRNRYHLQGVAGNHMKFHINAMLVEIEDGDRSREMLERMRSIVWAD